MANSLSYRLVIGSCILTLAAIAGCEEPFTPKGEFRNELVVYCILDDMSTIHYVRVYHTYNPPDFDPFEYTTVTDIPNASVSVFDGSQQISFRDTLISRKDTTRYRGPVAAYVSPSMVLKRGNTYALRVSTPELGSTFATMTIPTSGQISVVHNLTGILSPSTADEPWIDIGVAPSSLTRGFRVQFFLKFEVLDNSIWTLHVEQVPYFISDPGTPRRKELFPTLVRSPAEGLPYSITYIRQFQVAAHESTRVMLYKKFYPKPIRFVSAIFVLTQVEKSLYDYYSLVHGFRDPLSIRIDEPDFTNLVSGVGVFGGFIKDTLSVSLP